MATKTAKPNTEILGTTSEETLELTQLVDNIAKAVAVTKAAQAAEKELKITLVNKVKPFWFKTNFGHDEPNNTFDVTGRNAVIQVDVINKYSCKPEIARKLETLLSNNTQDIFENRSVITIDVSHLTRLDMEYVMNQLQDLNRIEEEHIEVKETSVVCADFHLRRHSVFIPAVNREIDRLMPVQVQVTV